MRIRRPAGTILAAMAVIASVLLGACTKDSPAKPASTPSTANPSSSGSATTPGAVAAAIDFTDCSDTFRTAIANKRANQMDFGCGKLAVPLDYSKPNGAKVNVFVVKVHSSEQKPADRIGSLLVNPGGPGGSGVQLAAGLVGELSDDVFAHFDIVGFDPRGIGLSTPIECISARQKDVFTAQDPDVRTVAGRTAARTMSQAIVRGCVGKYGSSLAHFNTAETAQDMDLIRQALGDSKLNYLGYSYGTRLGAAYAHQFPTQIRVAVLDGALDPVTDELTIDERQIQGFERAFDQFAADCLTRSACAVLGNPRQAVENLIASADVHPIASSNPKETRRATGGIVTTAVASALYDRSQWNELGNALVAARKGDAKGVFSLADAYNERDPDTGNYSNLMDANLAVNCNDSTLVVTDQLVATKGAEWIKKYPIFGKNGAASLYNCYGWPKSGHPLPPASAPGAPPILVVGTVHDPATPYAATAVLAKALGSGVVLSWDGEGHTAYPKTQCITAKVNRYLIESVAPASGASCPAA